ncbi:hypothetical protein LXL04_026007 [Taraxacum kok-saghyz]
MIKTHLILSQTRLIFSRLTDFSSPQKRVCHLSGNFRRLTPPAHSFFLRRRHSSDAQLLPPATSVLLPASSLIPPTLSPFFLQRAQDCLINPFGNFCWQDYLLRIQVQIAAVRRRKVATTEEEAEVKDQAGRRRGTEKRRRRKKLCVGGGGRSRRRKKNSERERKNRSPEESPEIAGERAKLFRGWFGGFISYIPGSWSRSGLDRVWVGMRLEIRPNRVKLSQHR